jgi:membrane-bound ClpP family serine protease
MILTYTGAAPSGVLAPALNVIIASPDWALTLVLAGIFLLYIEFNRPGKVVFAALGIFSATLGGYALLQHPIDAGASAVIPLGIGLAVVGVRFPAVGALSILTLTWALHNLLLSPQIGIASAFLVSTPFVLVTNWLGGFALQARRNKRLPMGRVQSPIPTPRPAVTPSRVD